LPDLSTWLLLLLLEEGEETDTGHLDDLETDTGDITLGVAGATETGHKDLILERELGFRIKSAVTRCRRRLVRAKLPWEGSKFWVGESTHVLLEEVETTVTWDESGNLLTVLDKLHADRLTDSRVRLLGLNSSVGTRAIGQRGPSRGKG